MKTNKFKQDRKCWYRGLKQMMKIRYKKPKFIYLGQKPSNSSMILSNHEGTDAPMSLEIYADFPIRMWGTYKMNSGLKNMYKYQSEVYYHEKKHWNMFAAKTFCLIASPLTNLFYKGLNLISTYQDSRFRTTLKESINAIADRKENLVIFPEKSPNGYVEKLEGFYAGFIVLAQSLAKKDIDVPIYTAYYKKKENIYIFNKPILFSEIKKQCENREQMIKFLLDSCNELGQMDIQKLQNTNEAI